MNRLEKVALLLLGLDFARDTESVDLSKSGALFQILGEFVQATSSEMAENIVAKHPELLSSEELDQLLADLVDICVPHSDEVASVELIKERDLLRRCLIVGVDDAHKEWRTNERNELIKHALPALYVLPKGLRGLFHDAMARCSGAEELATAVENQADLARVLGQSLSVSPSYDKESLSLFMTRCDLIHHAFIETGLCKELSPVVQLRLCDVLRNTWLKSHTNDNLAHLHQFSGEKSVSLSPVQSQRLEQPTAVRWRLDNGDIGSESKALLDAVHRFGGHAYGGVSTLVMETPDVSRSRSMGYRVKHLETDLEVLLLVLFLAGGAKFAGKVLEEAGSDFWKLVKRSIGWLRNVRRQPRSGIAQPPAASFLELVADFEDPDCEITLRIFVPGSVSNSQAAGRPNVGELVRAWKQCRTEILRQNSAGVRYVSLLWDTSGHFAVEFSDTGRIASLKDQLRTQQLFELGLADDA